MKIIIGAGCVGLSMAYQLLKKYNNGNDILILDRYNLPTKGTSLKNSGVLHAGLYYPPNSEKSKLCINGHYELKNLCLENNLPILKCGKLIIASDAEESTRLENLYKNAINCGRNVSIVDYDFAKKIQPEVKKGYSYLWSPETCVFSPSEILNFLYKLLLKSGVKFIKDKVLSIDVNKSNILTKDNGIIKFRNLFNCAGPGSLDLYKKTNLKESELTILPILGQYGVIPFNKKLKTNLYPVPDPNLPFLGIHLTPMINGNILVGPNAVPVFKKDVQGIDLNDYLNITSRLFNHTKLFISNSQNYRNHALNELTFSVLNKFKNQIKNFIELEQFSKTIYIDNSLSGIRPQLYNSKENKLINDFIYEVEDNIIHIINAVSPAFTSCLSLSKKMINIKN